MLRRRTLMPYRAYPPPLPLEEFRDLIEELPADHLARLVERVVEAVVAPTPRPPRQGNVPYDPRVCLKVLVYGYATGTRSSRQLERLCRENLPYLFLTRGQAPCYHTLSTARLEEKEYLEAVWVALFAVAERLGVKRVGHVVVDSTKIRANASPEAVVTRDEYEPLRAELTRILEVAQEVDAREEAEGYPGETRLKQPVETTQMRELLRQVRTRLGASRRAASAGEAASPEEEGASGRREKKKPRRPGGGGSSQRAAPPQCGEPTADAAPSAPPERPPAGAASVPAPAGEPPGGLPLAPVRLTRRMLKQIAAAIQAVGTAIIEGWEYLCLTDPDARMMAEGREKRIRECYSFEVAVDSGLLVAGQTTSEGNDNARLEPLVEAARPHEPNGIKKLDADSGYFAGDAVGRQIRAGVDTCVPDSNTAADLHRHQPIGTRRAKTRGSVEFVYEAEADVWRCPEGNELHATQRREHGGQEVTTYRAKQSCHGCPRAAECLTQRNAKHRTLKIGEYHEELAAARERFGEPAHQARYRHRGEQVETVFGFVRGTLGYDRWLLRSNERVAQEGRFYKVAYQMRKIHSAWVGAPCALV
jgi:transposase